MKIDGIFRAPAAGAPMESLEQGHLITGVGLEGDRYANQEGTYSVLTKEPGRQLTLINGNVVNGVLLPDAIPSEGDLRRNIVLGAGGVDFKLEDCIGKVLALGDTCLVFLHRVCVPCMYNEKRNGVPGLMEKLWDVAGVNAEVLFGGRIAVGNNVRIVTDYALPLPNIDDGGKLSPFYIRPSQRSAEMVKDLLEARRQAKAKLLESDPEGVRRAEASFASVGLTFFPPDK